MPAPSISIFADQIVETPVREGDETTVQSRFTNQNVDSVVTRLTDGSYAVTWESNDASRSGIWARLFNSDGSPRGDQFQINTFTPDQQLDPDITWLPGGGFVVTWTSNSSRDGDAVGIFGQIYNADGTPRGGEFQVNTIGDGWQTTPKIETLSNGNFVVAWTTIGGVAQQVFNRNGDKVGPETLVTPSDGNQGGPYIETLSNGNYIVSWISYGQEEPLHSSHSNVYAQIFDNTGSKIGDEFRLNSTIEGSQNAPLIISRPDGEFTSIWTDQNRGTYAQKFDADGNRIGDEFELYQVNPLYNNGLPIGITGSQKVVESFSDGGFVMAWSQSRFSNLDVFTQRYDSNGNAIGETLRVNINANNYQGQPGIVIVDDTTFVVTWTDLQTRSILSQRFSIEDFVSGATSLQSDEDAPLDLVMEIEPSTTDGSETITDITISGLPTGFALTAGTQNPDGSWTLTTAQLAGLQIIPRLDYTGTFDLTISATSTNNSTGDTETAISNVGIMFGDGNGQTFLGTSGDDVFTGGGFDDTIEGKEGDDTLKGGEGDDFISGGAGADELRGEAGFDTLDYSSSSAGLTVNLGTNQTSGGDAEGDTISGFEAVVGSDHDDTIFGYSNDETLSGGAGNDYLRGGDGNDTLNGDAGNDLLHGGTGTDTMNGGDGDDEFYSYDDGDIIDGGAGIDWVNFDQKTSGVNIDLSAANPANRMGGGGSIQNVENIFGTAFDDIMVGDGVRNMFRGGAGNDHMSAGDGDDCIHAGEGDDFLSGGDGVDLLKGGAGIDQINGDGGDDFIYSHNDGDIIDGGTGIDKVTFEQANAGVTVNLGAATAADRVLGATSMSNVENIKGTAFADTITGDAGVNHLFGSGGNDTLNGAAGDDHLYGGDGDDIINGGDDNDLLHGGVGADQLNGDAGDDTIYSYADGDIIDGGSGIDRVLFEQATSGVTVNLGAANLADTMQGTGAIQNVENVYGSAFNDDFTGDANANKLFGLNGDDILNGEGANDQLYGGSGNDTANGGSGNDYIEGGSGNDILSGGSGNDTVHGGSGNDTFVFKAGFDRTTVQDFTQGDDKLQFDLSLFQNFQDVIASAVQTGSDVTISWDNGVSVAVLQVIDINNLTSDDFTFV